MTRQLCAQVEGAGFPSGGPSARSFRRLRVVVRAAAVLMLFSMALYSQTVTSTVLGTVIDSQGSAIPNATVVLTSATTREERSTRTDVTGGFSFPSILAGTFSLRAQAEGFQAYQQTDIVVSAAQRLSVGTIELKVGSIQETVTVKADAAVVATASAEGSAVLNSRQVDTIALRGRNVTSYLKLLPGVSTAAAEVEALNVSDIGTVLPDAGGIRRGSMSMGMDGANGQDNGQSRTYTTSVSPEAVQEVKVLLNSYQAEYGRNGGMIVNMITKSGTQEFHGSGYWYKRHEMFNAQNFFNNAGGLPKAAYRYLTGGVTLGGPFTIPRVFNPNRDKLFFFFNIESNPSKEPATISNRTMPTPLERQGDFSQSFDQSGKLFVVRDSTTGAQFPGNIIPPGRLDKNGQVLMGLLPLPNRLDRTVTKGAYNYEYQDVRPFTRLTELFRIDYHPTGKDILFFRGTLWNSDRSGNLLSGGSFDFAHVVTQYKNKNAVLNYTRIVSQTMVNELTLSIRRHHEILDPLDDTDPAAGILRRSRIGFTAGQLYPQNNLGDIIPRAVWSGIPSGPDYGTFNWGRIPMFEADTNWSIADGYTITRPRHTFKFGLYYENVLITQGVGANSSPWNGYYAFGVDSNDPAESGNPYANSALGHFTTYREASSKTKPAGRGINFDWYVQDSWRVASRLTLEIGLRVQYNSPYHQWDGQQAAFALGRYSPAKAPVLYRPGMAGGKRVAVNPITGATTYAAVIGGYVPNTGEPGNGYVTASDNNYPRGFFENPGELLQPRFGFAWDVFGDGKTAVRGGFGLSNSFVRFEPVSAGPPIIYTPVLYYDNLKTFRDASATLFPADTPAYDRYMKAPTYYNASLGVQRNVGLGLMVDVKYVSVLGRHLNVSTNINQIPYGARFLPGNVDTTNNKPLNDYFLRPYPGVSNITYYNGDGSSNYHGLQIAANRRAAGGVQFGVAYTFSKTMDYGTSMPRYMERRAWNYGKTDFDQTHMLVINSTYDLPRMSRVWENPLTKLALDNWQLSGIATFTSGTPRGITLTTTTGVDLTGGGDGQRVIVTGDPRLPHGQRNIDHFFNTAVFALPQKGSAGNAPSDVFRGPGQNNIDVTVFKSVPLKSEQRRLQLRWEVYNLLNHTQFLNVDATARFDPATGMQTNARFGRPTSARNPRLMQIALRFIF